MPQVTNNSADDKALHDAVNETWRKALRRCINTAGQTCNQFKIPDHDGVAMIMGGLLYEVITGAVSMHIDEKEYLRMCKVSWDRMAKDIKDHMEEQSQ